MKTASPNIGYSVYAIVINYISVLGEKQLTKIITVYYV